MSPVDPADTVTGLNFALANKRNFSPISETRNGQRSKRRVLVPNSRNKANMVKHQNFNFRAYQSFGNS